MEYKCKEGMIDNRIIKDDHQQGIERVKQRSPMPKGQGGKMKAHTESESHWKRGNTLTPRQG